LNTQDRELHKNEAIDKNKTVLGLARTGLIFTGLQEGAQLGSGG